MENAGKVFPPELSLTSALVCSLGHWSLPKATSNKIWENNELGCCVCVCVCVCMLAPTNVYMYACRYVYICMYVSAAVMLRCGKSTGNESQIQQ